MKWYFTAAIMAVMSVHAAHATDLGCVSTTFNALSPNDKVCVSVFDDPQVPGVACDISQARKGGWGQPFGLNDIALDSGIKSAIENADDGSDIG